MRGVAATTGSSASRTTASASRSVHLDALRAVAVLMVLAGHAYLVGGTAPAHTSRAPGDMVINAGGAGIWIFFTLSGYLIAAPFLSALLDGRPLPSLRRYAVRRAGRILPGYWVALVAVLILLPPAELHWWQLPLHLGLLQNLVPGEGQALFFVAWTLGIEALFYAFVGLAAYAVRAAAGARALPVRSVILGLLALWALSLAWTVVAALAFPGEGAAAVRWADVARLSLPGLLSAFCPGMLVAAAEHAGAEPLRRMSRHPGPLLAAGAVCAVVGMLAFTASASVVFDLSRVAWSLAAGALLIAALGTAPGRVARALAPIGIISYGLYLWHYVIERALVTSDVNVQAGAASWPVRTAVVLLLAAPLALASWLLVERPVLVRTARWRAPARPARAAAAAPEPLADPRRPLEQRDLV